MLLHRMNFDNAIFVMLPLSFAVAGAVAAAVNPVGNRQTRIVRQSWTPGASGKASHGLNVQEEENQKVTQCN